MHHAAIEGKLDFVKMLVKWGADVDPPNIHGGTPFWLAIEYDHKGTTEFLRSKGAKVDVVDQNGYSLL